MCVLDLNKVLMQEFHYKNKYGNKSRLLFTETDSLMYEDFNADEEMFDFSYYSVKPKYYDDLNKLFVVTINDETVGVAIEKFVELKPKMY